MLLACLVYVDWQEQCARSLVIAAEQGDTKAMRSLLAGGVSPNAKTRRNRSALQAASINGQTEAVRLLLDKGAEPNDSLSAAAYSGSVDILTLLVAKGAKVSGTAGTPALCEAVDGQHLDAVNYLLKQGAEINAADPVQGRPPLLRAASWVQWPIFHTLLVHGANIAVRASDGSTALMHAAGMNEKNSLLICRCLVSHGADVNATDTDGKTALLYVAYFGPRYGDGNDGHYDADRLEMLRWLLHNGAKINARDKDGRTALRYAAEYRSANAKVLLKSAGGHF